MLEYRRSSSASPEAAWNLLARPEAWSEWAPHLRGAWRLGAPEVEPGSRGAARVAWILPVPATITQKEPGRSWRWQVGPYSMRHRVEPNRGGCDVVLEVEASGPLERLFHLSYGMVIPALLGRLAVAAAGRDAA